MKLDSKDIYLIVNALDYFYRCSKNSKELSDELKVRVLDLKEEFIHDYNEGVSK